MAKTKAGQRLLPVSTEYVAYDKLDRDAIYAAIGCSLEFEQKTVDGVAVNCLHEKVGFWPREKFRLKCVDFWVHGGKGYRIHRKVMVKDGILNLTEVDRKIAELAQLKAADEERSRIQQAERDRATAEKQAFKSEAEAAGLSFGYYGLEPRPIVAWVLQDDLTLAVDKHSGLSIGQAIAVQKLIESFQEVY